MAHAQPENRPDVYSLQEDGNNSIQNQIAVSELTEEGKRALSKEEHGSHESELWRAPCSLQ
jgi:hypothetical protein